MFMLSFGRELMDNESYGFKSYQALWFRIQSEVVSNRFNRFADIIDLDRLGDEVYTTEAILQMSEKIASVLKNNGIPVKPLEPHEVSGILERSEYGSLGIPYLIIHTLTDEGRAS